MIVYPQGLGWYPDKWKTLWFFVVRNATFAKPNGLYYLVCQMNDSHPAGQGTVWMLHRRSVGRSCSGFQVIRTQVPRACMNYYVTYHVLVPHLINSHQRNGPICVIQKEVQTKLHFSLVNPAFILLNERLSVGGQ